MSGTEALAGGKILIERAGPVATITINRPERRNALDRESARALRQAFDAFAAEDTLRVAVLTGVGGPSALGRTSRSWPPASTTRPGQDRSRAQRIRSWRSP